MFLFFGSFDLTFFNGHVVKFWNQFNVNVEGGGERVNEFLPSNSCLCWATTEAHWAAISFTLTLPPYSEGRRLPGNFPLSFSRLLMTENLRLILSLRRVLQNSNTAHMGNGRLRRLISLCLIGRFFSQIERTLLTSWGVQMDRWLRVRPVQSNM